MDVSVVSTVKSNQSILDMLNDWKTDLLARTNLLLRLGKGNTTIQPGTPLNALEEADFSGYSAETVSALTGPALDQGTGSGYLTTNLCSFQQNGGAVGNIIYSAYITSDIDGGVEATGTVTTTYGVISNPIVTAGGSGYLYPPKVTVLGGGTGARVTATIVGGVVVDLVLEDGGTGYVGATLVIDPPIELIAGGMLESPWPMQGITDFLATVAVLNNPAGS